MKSLFETHEGRPADVGPGDLNSGQARAVEEVLDWAQDASAPRFLSLSGPAGSGKTTLQRILAAELGRGIVWSAMTGRATRRMREAANVPGRTTHAAIYHAPREVDNAKRRRIDLVFEEVRKETSRILAIDEASMIDRRLLGDIERSPYQKVLFIGDGYQIPPVSEGDSDDWSIFCQIPGPRLTEVMRTSGAIVEAATSVREQQRIPGGTIERGGSRYDFSTDFRSALRDWFDDPTDHVLITWKNEVRMRLSRQIRQILGRTGDLEPGEPVIIRRNDYDRKLLNGDLLYVDQWLGDGPEIAGIPTRYLQLRRTAAPPIPVANLDDLDPWGDGDLIPPVLVPLAGRDYGPFDGALPYVALDKWRAALAEANSEEPMPITYGYVYTGHLIQGSEYRRATTLLFNDCSNRRFRKPTRLPDGGQMMFAMRWIYTAITRAKERSVLVGGE